MSYLIGASIHLHIENWKPKLCLCIGGLLLYHIAIVYLPYPGKEAILTPTNNLAAWLDRNLIPTHLYNDEYDPEGSIRIVTGGMLSILGGLIGCRIRSFQKPSLRCAAELSIAGLLCLSIGWLWSFYMPIAKDLWSSSFIMWSAGWSLLLLSVFYIVIDVCGYKKAGWIFIPVGLNAITIYSLQYYFPMGRTEAIFRTYTSHFITSDSVHNLVFFGGAIVAQWLGLFWLYRKRIFLRV